jgi:F0F1-type ATP synthase membrane subunit c/vacuolar-type H+-ATPase subunit K
MDSENKQFLESTRKQALYLWAGLCLSMTLFYVQSQIVFIKRSPLPSSRLEWMISFLGLITFVLGLLFFKNYMALRKSRILKMPLRDRKQSVLIALVLQFILFETLGLYGVLLSVWTQSSLKAIPFLLFAYIGFYWSFPRRALLSDFFS